MKTSLSKGDDWIAFNNDVDAMLWSPNQVSKETLESAINDTSRVFASDMLVLKFIQGLPVIGIAGGIFNPIYYNKIMNYVRLKYHKRYLLDKLNTI